MVHTSLMCIIGNVVSGAVLVLVMCAFITGLIAGISYYYHEIPFKVEDLYRYRFEYLRRGDLEPQFTAICNRLEKLEMERK